MDRLLMFVFLVSMCSCLRLEDKEINEFYANCNRIPVKVYVESPQLKSGSKSLFFSDEMDRLTDLNIFMYHNGRLLEDYCGYFDDMASVMLSFPIGKDGFNIYMFGNVGRCDAPSDENDISNVRYVVGEYSSFRVNGVPVAGAFIDFRRGSLAEFPLKRLVGQFDIRMHQSADQAEYRIKDVRVMNCALDVYPFSNNEKARLFSRSCQYDEKCSGDMLTEEDIERLNQGQSVSLYFIENLQGELLPGNTDRKAKIPSSLSTEVAECCTYVEITADVTTQIAKYTDARYRFYPGENETTDFSIRRNTLYEIVLDFTQNMVYNQEWRIEASEPDVVGVWMDKQEAMVIKGAEDMIFVRAVDNGGILLDFEVESLSSSGYVNVSKEVVEYGGEDCVGLRFTSNVDLAGVYPVGGNPSYLTETIRLSSKEMFDGKPLIVRDIPVRIYYKLFPLHISLEKRSTTSPYSIALRSRNPMGLGISVSSNYVCNGKSYETEEFSAYDYVYEDQGRIVTANNSVGVAPRYLGDLSSTVQYNNLTSLNLSVRGVSDESVAGLEEALKYPKLQKEAQLYTGADTKVFFGPGSDLRPAVGRTFPDDEICYFDYVIDGIRYTRSIEDERSGSFWVGGLMRFCICRSGHVYMNVSDGHCVGYAEATGCQSVLFDETMQTEHAALPFYIVNACMSCRSTLLIPSGTIGNWNNKTNRGVTMEFWGPGRDLFSETRDASVTANRRHTLEFLIDVWTNFFGTVKTQLYRRRYVGGSFLTVNGASAWVGGDDSEYGISADKI